MSQKESFVIKAMLLTNAFYIPVDFFLICWYLPLEQPAISYRYSFYTRWQWTYHWQQPNDVLNHKFSNR